MPPSPQSSKPPANPERQATILESDDDIRKALHSLADQQGDDKNPQPAKPAAKTAPQQAGTNLYRPMQRPPIALLTILDDGKGTGEMVRLRSDRFIIGRSEGDFLIPHDQQISARHLEITRQFAGNAFRWVLTDLQSSNGLFIRVSRTVLADKAEFLVGAGHYLFEAPGNQSETVDDPSADAPRTATRTPGISSASLMQPALLELVSGKVLSRMPLAKQTYWIGSDKGCLICRAGDPFVEPKHVCLFRDTNGLWHAQNNKTTNGLWLKMAQFTVTESCSFQIGEQRFRLQTGG